MLKVGIIGVGNTGNQIASLAKDKLDIPVMAINSSAKDLDTISKGVEKYLLVNEEGVSQGAGKNRALAKKYLKDSIMKFLSDETAQKFPLDMDVVFIIGSTGGGTGSGTAPILLNVMAERYIDTHFILVGVGPVHSEALSAQVNTLEYLNELYGNLPNATYMLYDNDNYANDPSYKMMDKVNNEVVEDINVLRGFFNNATKYDSIDTEDNMRLVSFPGRISVFRVENVREKDLDSGSLEERLIAAIKSSAHMELQRDKKVMATGLIMNLSDQFMSEFNNHIPSVHEFIGEPVHEFLHVNVNTDRKQPNSIYLIMSGLSPVNDKIMKINERIEEIEERQRIQMESMALDSDKLGQLGTMIGRNDGRVKDTEHTELNLGDIFGKFGM